MIEFAIFLIFHVCQRKITIYSLFGSPCICITFAYLHISIQQIFAILHIFAIHIFALHCICIFLSRKYLKHCIYLQSIYLHCICIFAYFYPANICNIAYICIAYIYGLQIYAILQIFAG